MGDKISKTSLRSPRRTAHGIRRSFAVLPALAGWPPLGQPLEAVVNANQQARRSDVRNRE